MATLPSTSRPVDITQDTLNLYWTTSDGVYSGPKSGAFAAILFAGSSCELTSDSDNVYWTDCQSPKGTVSIGRKGGGVPVWSTSTEGGPAGIAVDATDVYWANMNDGTIRSVPIGGGVPTTVQSGLKQPLAVAIDNMWVYWTSIDDSAILKGLKTGGGVQTVAEASFPTHLAVDDAAIYWASGADGIPAVVAKVAK